jgi:hypothetical protein
MTKFAQKIRPFFCRPCGEYHENTCPHYLAQKQRSYQRRKAKEAELKTQQQNSHQ